MEYREQWLDEEPIMITVREVVYDPLEAPTLADTPMFTPRAYYGRRSRRWLWALVVIGLLLAGVIGGFLMAFGRKQPVYVIVENPNNYAIEATGGLSPIFTPQVQFWTDEILAWAEEYDLDPNLIATVMQIESCGDPTAGSSAGAQGLFQVMPFHFAEGEQMQDVQTNAKRGLAYLSGGLALADGHAGLAMAGYNGGHGVIGWGWARWPDETRRYYYWGSGIYADAVAGNLSSARLNEWLAAGGSILCNQASITQQTLS